jgi:hypothetical protein
MATIGNRCAAAAVSSAAVAPRADAAGGGAPPPAPPATTPGARLRRQKLFCLPNESVAVEKKMYPISIEDFCNDPRGIRFQRVELAKRVITWSKYNSALLAEPPASRGVPSDGLYNSWHDFFISEYTILKEQSLTVHIFIELARTHFLMAYPLLMKDRAFVEQNPTSEKAMECDLLWKGILKLTQSELMEEVLSLVQEMQWGNGIDQFERISRLLFTRCGIFFCTPCDAKTLNLENMRTIHDDVNYRPNMDFANFATIYFHAIQRRIFYTNECPVEPVPSPNSVRAEVGGDGVGEKSAIGRAHWFENVVCAAIGPSGYEDCKMRACQEAYKIPGDDEWFAYRNPNAQIERGAVLDTIRKQLAKKYFAESAISLEATLATMDSNDYYGRCSRLFALHAIDAYMRMKYRFDWHDVVVIENDQLHAESTKLLLDKIPHLVELTNFISVHYKGHFYQSNSIYETLGCWFDIVERDFNSTLFGCRVKPH